MQNARPPVDIDRRTFEFALRVVKLCSLLTEASGVARTIGYQLVKCGTTIGAILEEAHAAHDKQEFAYKMGFALKEARLTNYWLRLLAESKLYTDEQLMPLLNESTEIMKIVGAIAANTRRSLS
jgi:four helix bundle protein